ncbi:Uncharacterised protein [Mycobacteroides abscessus subsp. abscessus]|nr:Uncharacterised protein [Mycobacteroides abscessus subsp. abscessus]SKU56552.1 Uncharacterised protein [Mycobacteroides abscessus subsp. abscessus]
MVRPLAVNTTCSPEVAVPASRRLSVVPRASAICEATVRCQISSYKRNSSLSSDECNWPGVLKVSPAGRMASCASCAFFTLRVYCRGEGCTYSFPYNSAACDRAACSAESESVVESVRI